jgi:hypothetical protein
MIGSPPSPNTWPRLSSLSAAWNRADTSEQAREILDEQDHELRGAEIEIENALFEAMDKLYDYFDHLAAQDSCDVVNVNRRYGVARKLSAALVEIDQALTVVSMLVS